MKLKSPAFEENQPIPPSLGYRSAGQGPIPPNFDQPADTTPTPDNSTDAPAENP